MQRPDPRQFVLGVEDGPLFTFPPLAVRRAAMPEPPNTSLALARVLIERDRQAEAFGHTAEADDERDLFAFAKGAGRLLHRMNETASLHRIEATRNDAVKLAAYALALAESCDRRLAALPRDPITPAQAGSP